MALLKLVVNYDLFLAGDWSKRRRLQRGSSDNLETRKCCEEAQGRPAESEAY